MDEAAELALDQGIFVPFIDALIGAIAGYLFFWLLFHGVRLVAKREALGSGDFKLFAALGAWLAWQQLPIALLISCLIGSVVGWVMIRRGVRDGSHYVPFGPFLAVGGLAALLWGPRILRQYWEWLWIY